MSDAYSDNRDTLRLFYAPKEKKVKAYDEALLQLRIAELEVKTAQLTRELSERTQDLLEALDELERQERDRDFENLDVGYAHSDGDDR